jgi:hypothetical protein
MKGNIEITGKILDFMIIVFVFILFVLIAFKLANVV